MEFKLGEYSKGIIKNSKLTSSLSSEKLNKNRKEFNKRNITNESNFFLSNLKNKICNENQLKELVNEMLLPNFINRHLMFIEKEKIEEILSKFQPAEDVVPGQSSDPFTIILKALHVSLWLFY